MSIPNPVQGSEETANIQSNVPNTPVAVTKYYKSVITHNTGTTDGSGDAAISFNIGSASHGYTVQVAVTVGSASCSTSFTPR
jgi:hypothetical protein